MKTLLLAAVLFASPALATPEFYTAPPYQEDFSTASLCNYMLLGRLVWKGQYAFYIQSEKLKQDRNGEVEGGFVDIVYMANDYKALAPFRKACN